MPWGARLGSGRTADIFALGEDRVVKLFHPGSPRELVESEFEVARTVRRLGLPAPAVHGLIEAEGRLGLVYDRVPGISMLAELVKAPWRMPASAGTLARLHAEIHRHDAPGLRPLRDRLASAIEGATMPGHVRRHALATLATLPDGRRLCHGDLHPDNVLMVPNGPPVVIDWMNATRGDPAGDVARTWLLLAVTEAPGAVQRNLLGTAGRRALAALYVRRYRRLTGLSRNDVAQWLVPVAAARLAEAIPAERSVLLRLATRPVR